MSEKAKHTPTPWASHESHIYGPDGAILAQVYNPGSKPDDYPLVENRDFIVRAVNAYDALVEALNEAREYFDGRADADCDQDGFIPNEEMKILAEIDAALKLAEGEQ